MHSMSSLRVQKQGRVRPKCISGHSAEPVYGDKVRGARISKEEYLKSNQKGEEKTQGEGDRNRMGQRLSSKA